MGILGAKHLQAGMVSKRHRDHACIWLQISLAARRARGGSARAALNLGGRGACSQPSGACPQPNLCSLQPYAAGGSCDDDIHLGKVE